MTRRQMQIERANPDLPIPTYGGTQCDCGHASWDHVDDTGKCEAPGCKCKELKEYQP